MQGEDCDANGARVVKELFEKEEDLGRGGGLDAPYQQQDGQRRVQDELETTRLETT